jgi:hypothetical protein
MDKPTINKGIHAMHTRGGGSIFDNFFEIHKSVSCDW